MIWLVRDENSYVDIYHNFMSYLPCVIATVLFIQTIWMKNLENLIFFFPNYTFTCEIVNILCLYEYFGLYTVPQTFRGITGISSTAHSFLLHTAALTKRSSAFSIAAFSQLTGHCSFSKSTAQPNTRYMHGQSIYSVSDRSRA
jgi:hypothetical protein